MKMILSVAMVLVLSFVLGCDDSSTEDPDTGVVKLDKGVIDATSEAGADADVDAKVPDQSTGDAGACGDKASLAAEALANGTKILNGVAMPPPSTPLADIAKSRSSYAGKTLRIEGIINEVCQSQGCYVTLDDGNGNQLNLKVTDGTVDFRKYAKVGHYAVGEGVYSTTGSHGAQLDLMKHGAMIGTVLCP
jgi:hypothetical protein